MTWRKYYHSLFLIEIQQHVKAIQDIKIVAKDSYKKNHIVKKFADILKTIERIDKDPTLKEYILGDALGETHRDWRRAKRLLPPRYRLFFKYFSEHSEIYYAWINNAKTLRKDGAKTDVYYVFKSMLDSEKVASDRDGLKRSSSDVMVR